jgi:hypothetical protein
MITSRTGKRAKPRLDQLAKADEAAPSDKRVNSPVRNAESRFSVPPMKRRTLLAMGLATGAACAVELTGALARAPGKEPTAPIPWGSLA